MSSSVMYNYDGYVVLESNQPEVFLSRDELFSKLKSILANRQDNLPLSLQKFNNLEQQTEYLLDTYCDLDMNPGEYLQWYAIRLEK